ncbi:HAD-IA family hydrolase [Aestuariivirga sp.]|uniref:HAD-IA family hydrolase n=1 Tax=Aestuariivirga sp. TaxID=2650926 RepID=UPI0039195C76
MKLAIFDVDGTLVDSSAMIAASLTSAFRAEGLPMPERARMMGIVGLSLLEAMKALAPEQEPAAHERLAAAYKQAFWEHRARGEHTEALFEGAHELLARLRSRSDVVLGIATGKSRRGVAHLIEKHGYEGWFATVQTADEHPSKPHPSMLAAALSETGLAPGAAVMIGDTSYDIAMARAAGVWAAGVAWGNHAAAELGKAGAHSIANDFKELELQLDSLWQENVR